MAAGSLFFSKQNYHEWADYRTTESDAESDIEPTTVRFCNCEADQDANNTNNF